MIKLKASYERTEELQRLLKKLGPEVKGYKIPRQQAGRFKKAYIILKP